MENNNSVAYIGRITDKEPIEGADRIESAQVEGWQSIVPKGKFNIGDFVLVLTTDAVIPTTLAETLGIATYLRDGSRVRTVRLKGVYSECIIVDPFEVYGVHGVYPVVYGKCLQKALNVYKHEPEAATMDFIHANGGVYKMKENQSFKKYEKFPNAKNVKHLFNENDIVVSTRKIHGTNYRAGIVRKNWVSPLDRLRRFFGNKWAGFEFVIGSQNKQRSEVENSVYEEVSREYQIKKRLWDYVKTRLNPKDIGSGITLYGEIYGAGVQGQHYTYGMTDRRLQLFDITVNDRYVGNMDFNVIAGILGLPTVEELYYGFFDEKEILSTVGGFIRGTNVPNEGAVVKTVEGGRRKVAKFINNDYLTFAEKKGVPDSH